jgi:hypothetical protein
LEKPIKKLLVFVIDEHGRTLTQESLHKLISELCDKVLEGQNVDVVAANGLTINICAELVEQIEGKSIAEWEIIYLHGSKYPPVLLTHDDKEKLLVLLPEFSGTSAEAIYKVLTDSGAFI